MRIQYAILIGLSSLLSVCLEARAAQPGDGCVLLTGGPQVTEGRLEAVGGKRTFQPVWRWRPENSAGLPAPMMRKFITTDESKPVSDGREILIASSGGAVALVSRETGATLFYAEVENAHSVALLPGGLIAAAASDSPAGKGDRVLLFDRRRSNVRVAELPLTAAHGVEWDEKRSVLWALGEAELLSVRIARTNADEIRMETATRTDLPKPGGHDLVLAPDKSELYVSNSVNVYRYLPESQRFSSFAPLSGTERVKSLAVHAATGQLLYTQADPGVWWTYTLRSKDPDFVVTLPEFAYKVRWCGPAQAPLGASRR